MSQVPLAPEILHATTVSIEGCGVVILGASGTGKSALALELMAFGATLVADDRTCIERKHDSLWASAPLAIRGKIEARGLGILNVPSLETAELAVAIDLNRVTQKRMPEPQRFQLHGISLPCIHKVSEPFFPAAVLVYVRSLMRTSNDPEP